VGGQDLEQQPESGAIVADPAPRQQPPLTVDHRHKSFPGPLRKTRTDFPRSVRDAAQYAPDGDAPAVCAGALSALTAGHGVHRRSQVLSGAVEGVEGVGVSAATGNRRTNLVALGG
jgi:hypothetical protein